MITKIKWHDFKKEGPPSDSRQVLITNGKALGTAHFFHQTYGPPYYQTPLVLDKFVNQHMRIIGGFIDTKNVTHWADTDKDIELPHRKGK